MKLLDRLRRKPKNYPPPPGPPNPRLLLPIPLPKVLPWHQPALSEQGWSTVTFNSDPSSSIKDPLQESLQTLFEASKSFFALPASYKSTFVTKSGSEEGWSGIPGEKEFITLRTTTNCPPELSSAVTAAWAQAGTLLNDMLGSISCSLGLPPGSLTAYSEPCAQFGEEKTATMLRLFRYEGHEEKVVAEPHCDLGLLSLVVGDSPGLEVWNRFTREFWAIEKSYHGGQGMKEVGSVLVGRQLQKLSNGRYEAGAHRVRAYGSEPRQQERHSSDSTTSSQGPYRYSIVFVLRAHSPVPIDTDLLTTEITGPFANLLKCTAGDLFAETKRKHYNINTGIKEREEQKKELKEKKELQVSAEHPSPGSAESDV
ncbi:hypothetical protein D9757_006901 [Collybiopsis confluens]|uniref:Isopenicillin N synthase-like Fe(2+) 2OG dioxygenase domain-containing protein n=1 Tax=Collybiopsis confluens TaxID=2823264 RepID=A0A8H5HPK2_9AGAR|nr:hypothetical protein D9757_006901 [Collybiopsis confluens]